MTTSRRFLLLAGASPGLAGVAQFAHAAGYPDKPVRLVVPFPARGATDLMRAAWARSCPSGRASRC